MVELVLVVEQMMLHLELEELVVEELVEVGEFDLNCSI